jgi:protein-S-isoprenylcysteine O-methyltransferase Ste14
MAISHGVDYNPECDASKRTVRRNGDGETALENEAGKEDGSRRGPLPPTYFWAGFAAMVTLHFLFPLVLIIPYPWNYAGFVPALGGLIVIIRCSKMFSDAGTTIKPFEQSTSLVTGGPYRFSRHPIYVGMASVLAGLAVFLGSLTPFFVMPVFVWVMAVKFIPAEEAAMEAEFGDEWRAYAARVRRWL